MSLSKQLGIGLFLALLFMFAGSLWSNVNNSRDFLSEQLQVHAQDTATSLGLSISPYLGQNEQIALVETMTNAIFDRGYYQQIELRKLDGSLIFNRQNPPSLDSVPYWFTQIFAIESPTTDTQINSGWQILGNLSVSSNPGIAYEQLWANALNSFYISLAIFFLSLACGLLLIQQFITKPINLLIRQSEDISKQHFTQISPLPKTKDLQLLSKAINLMSKKLSIWFTHMSEQSEKYKLFAYTDSLTKVGNRRAFNLYMEQLLRNENERPSGYFLLVQASSLKAINASLGNKSGDSYLQALVKTSIESCKQKFSHFAIYRLSGSEFGLVLENSHNQQLVELAKTLSQGYKRQEKSEHRAGYAHIGITSFTYSDSLSQALRKADSALAVALNNEKRWELADNLPLSHSNHEWREKIKHILASGTSDFVAQNIVDIGKNVEYAEWFARLPNEHDSASLPMNQLIPASVRLDYAKDLDKLITKAMIQKLPHLNGRVGLNVSRLSILDADFMQYLISQLNTVSEHCHKLVLEIPERALVHDIETLVQHTRQLQSMNISITVEHYGAQLAGFRHLQILQPDYLKIDGRFTNSVHEENDKQLFLLSLIKIAQGLNIKVIAEMIETQQEYDWFVKGKVDLLQGYYIDAPKGINGTT